MRRWWYIWAFSAVAWAQPAPTPAPAPAPPAAPTALTLAEAAVTAMKNHPDLKVAQGVLDQAQAAVRTASAPFYPKLNGNVGFSYSEAQSAGVAGQSVVRAGGIRNYSVGLSASQTLTDFGKTQAAVDAADHAKLAAEWQKTEAVQKLLLNVAEAYFAALRTHQDVQINLDNVRNAEVQVQRARGFYSAGAKAKIDVTRAESDLANANLALIQAKNSEQKARAAFVTALGLHTYPEYQLAEQSLKAPAWSQEEAVKLAQESHPTLQAAFARVRAAEARLRNAEAQYYPQLDATYRYSWGEQYFPPQPYNWSVGMNLSVPLFNEPILGAGVQSAEASRVQAEGTQEQVALQVHQSALEAWFNLQEARARVDAAGTALLTNQENFRLASERYNVGVGSSLEVSDAQRLLVQARSQEVQARFDLQLAIARLYRQAGNLNLENLLPAQ